MIDMPSHKSELPPLPPASSSANNSNDDPTDKRVLAFIAKHCNNVPINIDISNDNSLKNHPLIIELKQITTKRIWSEKWGGMFGAILTIILTLFLPNETLQHAIDDKHNIQYLLTTLICALIMARANYVEHYLQPPVEPYEIVKSYGKLCFFTVNVIGTCFIYFTAQFLVEFARTVLNFSSPTVDDIMAYLSPPVYTLGCILSIFYYAGVFADDAEKDNINKWQNRGEERRDSLIRSAPLRSLIALTNPRRDHRHPPRPLPPHGARYINHLL